MKVMKKTLAILLCLAMCLSMMPTWALAEAPETDAALMSEEPTAEVMQEPIPEEVTLGMTCSLPIIPSVDTQDRLMKTQ